MQSAPRHKLGSKGGRTFKQNSYKRINKFIQIRVQAVLRWFDTIGRMIEPGGREGPGEEKFLKDKEK